MLLNVNIIRFIATKQIGPFSKTMDLKKKIALVNLEIKVKWVANVI